MCVINKMGVFGRTMLDRLGKLYGNGALGDLTGRGRMGMWGMWCHAVGLLCRGTDRRVGVAKGGTLIARDACLQPCDLRLLGKNNIDANPVMT